MKTLKENWFNLLTILFLIVVGILLLINPLELSTLIIQVAGILIALFGLYRIFKYFWAKPEEAARNSDFFIGAVLISAGMFCLFSVSWFERVFPAFAVIYGILQILLGYQQLQQMIDRLRLKLPKWWLNGISAAISLLFGFLIVANPTMQLIDIWIFTGIAMILEGVFSVVVMILQHLKEKPEIADAPVPADQSGPVEEEAPSEQ